MSRAGNSASRCFVKESQDCREDLARIDVPALTAGLRTAKLIKGARLLVVKGGPHCITWTHADEVNTELLSFLGQKIDRTRRGVA